MEIASGPLARDVYLAAIGQVVDFLRSFGVGEILVAYGWGALLTLFAIGLNEWTYQSYGGLRDRVVLLACALVEGHGYRQLTTFWRLKGLWNALRGRTEWGAMTRAGFGRPAESEP